MTGTNVKTVRKVMTGTDQPPPPPFQGLAVSLTFTSAIANQYAARQILADHGMDGTFYVNSGRVGLGGRLTWRQVHDLATDGNEIGGQSFNNPFLSGLDPVTLAHQICDDRTTLMQKGYSPTSFAWPHGSADADAAAQNQVQQCGYTSGRGDTGLGGTGQPKAESIPPQNPYVVRTRGSVDQERQRVRDRDLDPAGPAGRLRLVPDRLLERLRSGDGHDLSRRATSPHPTSTRCSTGSRPSRPTASR